MTDPAAVRTADARATDAVAAGEADTPDEADFRPLSLPRIAARLIAVAVVIILVALVTLLAHQRTTGVTSQNFHTVFWYYDVGREYNLSLIHI